MIKAFFDRKFLYMFDMCFQQVSQLDESVLNDVDVMTWMCSMRWSQISKALSFDI